jgi:hypothetical protein
LDYLKTKFEFDINNPDPYKSEPFAFVDNTRINIEQILSSIEEDIHNGNKELEKTRKEAVRFIYLTLENAIKDGPSPKNCYPDFVKKINTSENDVAIITLNYETLLERALQRGSFSYGIPVDTNKIINFPSYETICNDKLLVLKLHGSLNWAICSSCNRIHMFWSQRYDDILKKICEECSTNLEAVLIPPTRFNKSSYLKNLWEGANLEKLWKIAGEKIVLADEITIIGYSFGEYDFDVTNLILNSIKANKKMPFLCIADPFAADKYGYIRSKLNINQNHFNKVSLFKDFGDYLSKNKLSPFALPHFQYPLNL